jgi:hypothetical protein
MIERHWNAERLAMVLGIAFVAIGLVGFTDNPLVSAKGIFAANLAHNAVHVATGVLFLAGAMLGASVATIRTLAVIYAIVAVAGVMIPELEPMKTLQLNGADLWLHAIIAMVLLLIGFLAPMERKLGHAPS